MAPPDKRRNITRPRCPPPLVRSPRTGRCVPPSSGGAPFGGPSSSPWSFGPSSRPAATPAPTPTPLPTCITPTIFADCFAVCAGTMSEVSPGPICGWTFDASQGSIGGTVTFSPGSMSFDTAGATEFPASRKPIPAPLTSVNLLTGQYSFVEYPTVPNPATTYNLYVTNFDLSEIILISLLGDGNVFLQVGDPAAAPSYVGTWTPNNGAHEVHFSVDALGVLTLWIDGVLIPLIFIGNIFSFASLEPPNIVAFGLGSADAAPTTAPVTSVFVTAGNLGPEAEFCCP